MKLLGFAVLTLLFLLVNSACSAPNDDKHHVRVMNLGTDKLPSEVELKEDDMVLRRLLLGGGRGGGRGGGGGSGRGGGGGSSRGGGGDRGGDRGGGRGRGSRGGIGIGGGSRGGSSIGRPIIPAYGGIAPRHNDSNNIGTPSVWIAAMYLLFSVFAFGVQS